MLMSVLVIVFSYPNFFMIKPIICQYKIDDLPPLWLCVDKVCAEEPWMATKRFEPDQKWMHALTKPECQAHLLLVAKIMSDIVGWCRLFPHQCLDVPKKFVLGIGLNRGWQNKGIGSCLLSEARRWAIDKNYDEIILYVSERNRIAHHFYKKNGFLDLEKQNTEIKMGMSFHNQQILSEVSFSRSFDG